MAKFLKFHNKIPIWNFLTVDVYAFQKILILFPA